VVLIQEQQRQNAVHAIWLHVAVHEENYACRNTAVPALVLRLSDNQRGDVWFALCRVQLAWFGVAFWGAIFYTAFGGKKKEAAPAAAEEAKPAAAH
jgi:hypothetical protein